VTGVAGRPWAPDHVVRFTVGNAAGVALIVAGWWQLSDLGIVRQIGGVGHARRGVDPRQIQPSITIMAPRLQPKIKSRPSVGGSWPLMETVWCTGSPALATAAVMISTLLSLKYRRPNRTVFPSGICKPFT